jgi:2-oxoglutarate dehydrogenase E2 component (dihydrolipoamide succinyltransferase)
MAIELKIPSVGESISEVQIGEWLKAEGDNVKQDEPVAVIDSEKTTFELPAPQNGRLTKILHQAGETVAVGAVVAQLEPGDGAAQGRPKGEAQGTAAQKTEGTKLETKPETQKGERTAPQPAASSPRVEDETAPPDAEKAEEVPRELIKEKPPVESKAEMQPTPPGAPAAPPPGAGLSPAREEEVVPMTMLRRTAAQRLVEAQQMMAMLTTFNEVDMSAVQSLRQEHQEQFEKRYQVKLGLMSCFIHASVDALKQYPQLNAEVRGNDIIYRNYFDIGVAVATDRGLVVPVLRNAERMAFADLEKAIADFARRAKDGKLKPDELAGGTFTITNGGVFGSLLSTPIINPPQTAILGLHAIQDRPVALQGQVVIRPMMYLALTYDHRLVDGREAVLFLRRIKQVIESPVRMLLEI